MKNSDNAAGFSMIEMLAAMFVISFGLLSILGLFVKGIRTTDAAYLHSQAVVLAYDLSDRIRANPSVLSSYVLAENASLIDPGVDCASQVCTPSQLAEADLYEWRNLLAVTLPAGDANVGVGTSAATISISWDQHGASESFSLVMN